MTAPTNPARTGSCAVLLQETAPARRDAPISGVGDFLREASIREMVARHAYERAKRDHRASKKLHRQWIRAKAQLIAQASTLERVI